MLSLMIRHCADVQSTPSLTSIKSEPATAITANDRSWHRRDDPARQQFVGFAGVKLTLSRKFETAAAGTRLKIRDVSVSAPIGEIDHEQTCSTSPLMNTCPV
jgi:hypothetical protein